MRGNRKRQPKNVPCPSDPSHLAYYKAIELYGQCLSCAVKKSTDWLNDDGTKRGIILNVKAS